MLEKKIYDKDSDEYFLLEKVGNKIKDITDGNFYGVPEIITEDGISYTDLIIHNKLSKINSLPENIPIHDNELETILKGQLDIAVQNILDYILYMREVIFLH